jgi:DNA topoisomerase I
MTTIHKTEKILLEAGFRQAYTPPPKAEDPPVIRAEQSRLKKLRKRQRVKPQAVQVQRQVTPPEPGLSEVELLRTLQAHGIGRPATYAGILDLLLQREYVTQDANGELHVTERGRQVCEFLTETYPHIFAPAYTARMEAALDAIAAGKRSYRAVLSEFWAELQAEIQP